MRAKLPLALALGVMLSPLAATAQDDAPPTMTRGMYLWCDQSKESRADEIVEESIGPVYDQLLGLVDSLPRRQVAPRGVLVGGQPGRAA